ncbi:MAG: alpha/beta hydrolase [candidate division Zixibacteria bacterium]|nr:alpha/beta hydrolase [candidate division Zixibacteria bacterium]NIT51626.1 alpha/beta hydrolase [candidate division Zixibacteria bacterium]NIU07990.1 alpha/beta hydrolase [Phycisphaerae bacterium]NIW39498.1 alpha/beta fold hydrolase [candidate division Zixibacteria bacterium]
MRNLKLYTNHYGEGLTVICLHSSASTSKQWRALIDKLADNYHVIAPDLYGYGQSPVWNGGLQMSLDQEVSLLEHLFEQQEEPVHLIGHSFGAALAMKAALKHPEKVKSLTVYEPVLFRLLLDSDGSGEEEMEIRRIRDAVCTLLEEMQPHEAARIFVNYWNGDGSWEKMDPRRHSMLAGSMRSVLMNFDSLFSDSTVLSDFSKINVPVLYLHGAESKNSTRRLTELLISGLPLLEFCILPGMGHMGPVTHAESVNAIILRFLQKLDGMNIYAQKIEDNTGRSTFLSGIGRCLRHESKTAVFTEQDSRSRLSSMLCN